MVVDEERSDLIAGLRKDLRELHDKCVNLIHQNGELLLLLREMDFDCMISAVGAPRCNTCWSCRAAMATGEIPRVQVMDPAKRIKTKRKR